MRALRGLTAVAVLCVGSGGCGVIIGPPVCTTEFVYGLNVTLTNADGQPVSGATVTLSEGAYVETMEELSDGTYVGAGERAGTYTLTVEAGAFEPVTIEGIFVDTNECHVIPVLRDVTLVAP